MDRRHQTPQGSPLLVRLGPFEFAFNPDGDDPDVGAVTLQTDSGYYASTRSAVTRDEWDTFVAECE